MLIGQLFLVIAVSKVISAFTPLKLQNLRESATARQAESEDTQP